MEEKIKGLFFNNTLRRWHFEDIVMESNISRERVNYYLKILLKDGFIIRKKPSEKMPYYMANRVLGRFRAEKRFYGLKLLNDAGLFEHLNSINGIRTAVLFGSFARGDWDKSSDIDLFIYGDAENFDKGRFERKIKRDIQLFYYKDAAKMKMELDSKLIPNIAEGFNIKGTLEPFKVDINA